MDPENFTVENGDRVSIKILVSSFIDTISFFIHPSKMGRIILSTVAGGRAGGRAASPILCPEHISKTMLATVMKLHGWIDLIKAECSAQEP